MLSRTLPRSFFLGFVSPYNWAVFVRRRENLKERGGKEGKASGVWAQTECSVYKTRDWREPEMRGFAAASAPPARRRWKGPAVAVLALVVVVVFSLLVPLAFLLGIHSHFPSGESPTLLGVVSLVPPLKNPKVSLSASVVSAGKLAGDLLPSVSLYCI